MDIENKNFEDLSMINDDKLNENNKDKFYKDKPVNPHMEEEQINFKLKKIHLWQGLTALFAILFVISWATGGFGSGKASPTGGTVAIPQGNNQPSLPSIKVNADDYVDDDPILGKKDAPITMVEFSDFQCPFCARFYSQTLNQIKSEYIDTGKVKFVYRDFPLTSIHPEAQPAAEAAECADEQGKFWEYHDKLFENQALLGEKLYNDLAKELGLNTDKFKECLDSGKYRQEVLKDSQDAQEAGGRGTPFFIIGSTPVSGAQPFSAFQAAIESQL